MEQLSTNNAEYNFIKTYTSLYFHDDVLAIERLNGHSLSHHYKVCCLHGIYKFRFVSHKQSSESIRLIVSSTECHILFEHIIDYIHINETSNDCIISHWIPGTTAAMFVSVNPDKIEQTALSIANVLQNLHQQNNNLCPHTTIEILGFCKYMRELFSSSSKSIPHLESYLELLSKNSDITPHKIGVCHSDLHLKNIIINDNGVANLIDLENLSVSDIWRDFVYATTFYENEYEKKLWRSTLLNYFSNRIPDEFWHYNFIYSTIKMLHMCMFELKQGNDGFVKKVSNDFYRIYNELSDPVPIYFKK